MTQVNLFGAPYCISLPILWTWSSCCRPTMLLFQCIDKLTDVHIVKTSIMIFSLCLLHNNISCQNREAIRRWLENRGSFCARRPLIKPLYIRWTHSMAGPDSSKFPPFQVIQEAITIMEYLVMHFKIFSYIFLKKASGNQRDLVLCFKI